MLQSKFQSISISVYRDSYKELKDALKQVTYLYLILYIRLIYLREDTSYLFKTKFKLFI